jgi:hypothetical protein
MDDEASTPTLTFLAAGTVFVLAVASLVATIDDIDPGLPEGSPDAPARELLDIYVRPFGNVTAVQLGSPATPSWSIGPTGTSSGTSSGSSTASASSTSSTSSTGISSSTGSFTGAGCSGNADKNCRATNGCDNGNLDANRKECQGSGSSSSSTTTTSSSSTTTTTTSSSTTGSTSPGTPGTPASGGGFLAGLSLRTGVLDPVRVLALLNGTSDLVNATDGRTSYAEAKQMLGYPADADFRLVFTKVRPAPALLLTDFGEPMLGSGDSRASAWFCWGTCADGIVRVDAFVG